MKPLIVCALILVAALSTDAQTAPKLLPFQGRLTDQNGVAVSNGLKLVQFKIYSVPTGGSPVWAGELHRTTVNGGLVNVMLGTKTPLSGVDFDKQLYLEITVDVSGPAGTPDNAITAADPPMLPRQAILPVVFAKEAADSRLLASSDWTPLFGTNSPAGSLLSSKIAPNSISGTQITSNSITAAQIQSETITSNQIAPGRIAASNLAPGSVGTLQIASNSIAPDRLALRIVGTNVPIGGVAISGSCGEFSSPTPTTPTTISNFSLTITTRGNPIEVYFVSDGTTNSSVFTTAGCSSAPLIELRLVREQSLAGDEIFYVNGTVAGGVDRFDAPPGSFRFLDFPPPGPHAYQVQIAVNTTCSVAGAVNMRMVVREL